MSVRIRAATPADAAVLAELSAQLGYPAAAPTIVDRLARIGAPDAGVAWVAVEGDGVCGFARALPQQFVVEEPFVELAALVVAEAARGQGVGAALLHGVEAWARQQGFAAVRVRSDVIRERAHRFYLREGYTEAKRQAVFGKDLRARGLKPDGGRACRYPWRFAVSGQAMLYDLPPVTRALLIANVVIFLLEQVPSLQPLLLAYGALWPVGPAQLVQYPDGAVILTGFHFWQIVTYAFLHGGWGHIFFNMFALWMFGGPIEHLLGAKHYTFFYFFCAVIAAIAHMLVSHYYTRGFYPTLGASGAIFGLLVAFGVMYPHMKMFLIFLPIPMPAWVFVVGYILLELFFGVSGYESGVAHFAHLGGAVGGFVLLQYWRGKLPIRPKRILTR